MPLPGNTSPPKSGKRPTNLVAVSERTWSTDADLEDATQEHSKKVPVYSSPSQIRSSSNIGPRCFKSEGF